MGINLADIKFPNYITGIKDVNNEWLKGGYDYQHMNPVGFSITWFINDFREFNVAEYLKATPGAEYEQETEWIKVFEFPNGYYQAVRIFKSHPTGQSAPAGYETNLFDENDQPVGRIANIYNCYSSGNNSIPADASILGVKFYIYLSTRYYSNVDPADGTPNNGLDLTILAGWPDNEFALTIPTYYWGKDAGRWFNYAMAYFLDLDAFTEYLHNHGRPFSGDVFTDTPFPPDPAGTDDPSKPGGGGGNYDDTSDPIDFPDVPTGGALECGAVVAHRVSAQTIEAIIAKLWDSSIFNPAQAWQKSIDDPMNAIVSLHCLPISPEVDGSTEIWIGNFDTGLSSPKVTSQYKVIDCGSLNIAEYWGSALDYSPYTRAEIFLPFIGVKDVSIEDIMNSTIHIKYNVDVLTGDCVAFIKCGLSVLYHFNGNCKMPVPLSARSTDILANAGLGAAGIVSAAGAVATGGSSLLVAGATISAATSVAGSKVRTARSGDLAGSVSLLDDFVPYVILHRPVQSLAKDYNKFKGFPSNITASLGSVSGYTEVEHIHLQNIPNATREEMDEIVTILKNGAIF